MNGKSEAACLCAIIWAQQFHKMSNKLCCNSFSPSKHNLLSSCLIFDKPRTFFEVIVRVVLNQLVRIRGWGVAFVYFPTHTAVNCDIISK